MRPGLIRWASCLLLAAAALGSSASGSAPRTVMGEAVQAARIYHMPLQRLLDAIHPTLNGGAEVMDLTPAQLRTGARLAGIEPALAEHDLRANIRAGAAFLASRPAPTRRPASSSLGQADYPQALWLPASPSDYRVANRPLSNRITMIVIHATDGSYAGTLSWFRNPAAQASAHYVIRSSDGQITQMVREKDIAWHAGNSTVNDEAIGIEHEGFTNYCSWFTDAMYHSSAQLVAYLVTKYLIPVDRTHIIGHYQVPDPYHPGEFGGFAHHTDPGPCWDWPKYMQLVRDYAAAGLATAVQRLADDSSSSAFAAPGWRHAVSADGYGRGYAYASPSPNGSPARFTLNVPSSGGYALYAWWPAGPSRSSSVPVGVDTATGRQWIKLDERKSSGGWTYLGTFPLAAGTRTVRLSRQTKVPGSIAADAVKVELVSAHRSSELAADGAWVMTPRGLSSTQDAGTSWVAMTPPGISPAQIRGARVDGQAGRLVVATGRTKDPLDLYQTLDGGRTWTASPLTVPRDVDVAAPVTIASPDSLHVFLALRLQPNRFSLSRGLLLRTADRGTTWLASPLPAAGDVAFPTATAGWLVGGFGSERLYATRDGGKSWMQVVPKAPVSPVAATAYTLPSFWTPKDGVLPVSLAAGARSALAFETTADGGKTWKTAATVKLPKPLPFGQAVSTAIAGPADWRAAVGGKLLSVQDGGITRVTLGTLPGAVTRIQFSSALTGWAEVGTYLYVTADGGATWTRLAPP